MTFVTSLCDVVASWLGRMMVLDEYGTPMVNYCWTQHNVLVIMDSQSSVSRGLLTVCAVIQ